MSQLWKHYAKTQRTTYYMFLFIWYAQNKQIYRIRKYVGGARSWDEEEMETDP